MRRRERPFWQAHYYDFNVSEHGKFLEKLRYIHRNPVKRGLVAKPEDWPSTPATNTCRWGPRQWSSFRHYATGVAGIVEIESEWTAQKRGWQLPEWMRSRQRGSSSPARVLSILVPISLLKASRHDRSQCSPPDLCPTSSQGRVL